MPRLSPSVIRLGAKKSPYLPWLLRECRDLESATNELRWLKEFVRKTNQSSSPHGLLRYVTSDRKDGLQPKQHHGWLARRKETNSVRLKWQKLVGRSQHRSTDYDSTLKRLVRRRSKGEPLQYILGTQPFGTLEILCRKHVLIPRPETEFYTEQFAAIVKQILNTWKNVSTSQTSVLDLCTGTGCISLLLYSLLRNHDSRDNQMLLRVLGLDKSPYALRLSNDNLRHNIEKGFLKPTASDEITFRQADVLCLQPRRDTEEVDEDRINSLAKCRHQEVRQLLSQLAGIDSSDPGIWDIVVSNPPYISAQDYAPGGTTSRSVRRYEPILALVPADRSQDGLFNDEQVLPADIFYQHILEFANAVEAKAIVMEIGDAHQAKRVKQLALSILNNDTNSIFEIWKDDGTIDTELEHRQSTICGEYTSNPRAVVIWRGKWANVRGSHSHLNHSRETI